LRFCLQLQEYIHFTVQCIHGMNAKILLHVRVEMLVLPAVTAVLLHHSAMDTWTDCNFVNTGLRGIGVSACSYSNTVTSQCYGHMH